MLIRRSRPWWHLPAGPVALSPPVADGWAWLATRPTQLLGAPWYSATSQASTTQVATSRGAALVTADAGNAGVSFGQVQPIPNPPFTLLLVAQLTARSTYRAVIDQRLGSGAFNSTSIRSNYRTVAKANNSGTLGVYFETGGSFSANSQIDGALHAWVFRKNGFGVGTAAMWRDGVAQTLGEDSGTGSNPNASTEQFRIGNHGDYSGTGFANPDPLLLFLSVPRALSDAECRALSSEWAQAAFAPQRILVPVPAGGGATTIVVADAAHSHAADNLTLTTDTALVIADITHAHAADSIALSTLTQLALDDALHGHTADAPTLSTQSLLAVDDAAHAHGAEAVVLGVTGATTLTVADATHAHTVDGIVLSAQSVLAIQDALHAHTADSITLDASGAAVLLLADALHAHTADGLALTVDAWLVVADAGHAHRVDAVVLTLPGADPPVAARYTITARARRLVIEARARRLEAVK